SVKELLGRLSFISHKGSLLTPVYDICIDSRHAKQGSLFIAITGSITDGHRYIDTAIKNGASSIICEFYPDDLLDDVTYVQVADSSEMAGLLAHTFFDNPSQQLTLVGVTGTNGKTTIAYLLYDLFSRLGYTAGLISTIDYRIGSRSLGSTHTTPNPIQLNRLLSDMVDHHCEYVFMEVSSHAIDQKRIAGLEFNAAIYTNLTHDHLDYHGDFKTYRDVKKSWFDNLPKSSVAVLNADDKHADIMVQNSSARVVRYGLNHLAPYKIKIIDNGISGLHLLINNVEMISQLRGAFNASNLGAVYACAIELDQDQDDVIRVMSELKSVQGRFEIVSDQASEKWGVVDYAHTPDALKNILTNVNLIKRTNVRLITVVGCGGDRDRAKRPIMAKIAAQLSDEVILTSDNPRSEDPELIIDDMMTGVNEEDNHKVSKITDRSVAIKMAAKMAHNGDVIVIAGKGHEDYQEINGVKLPFDDVKILKQAILL
ncbi:UNVERIFIED_CONTAM: hypothetical protein GTU68_014785, partial [Idotea baltica]|nr:hypothetical protein [Idotea baltica]